MKDSTWKQYRKGQKVDTVTDLISSNELNQVNKIKLITQFDTADIKSFNIRYTYRYCLALLGENAFSPHMTVLVTFWWGFLISTLQAINERYVSKR